MFNDQVSTCPEANGLAKRRFDLTFDAIMLKYLCLARIKLYDLFLFRCNVPDETLDVFIDFFVIYMDVVKRFVEHVAQQRRSFIQFSDNLVARVGSCQSGHALFPCFDDRTKVAIEFCDLFALGDSTDNDAEVFGLNGLYQPKKSFSFFAAGNFFRNAYCVGKWYQNQVPAGKS